MISKSESEKIYSIALKEIKQAFPGVKGVYVFGSFATGEANQDSDLDLAVLLNKPADKVKLWDVAQNISVKVQKDVDLIDLLSASTVFQFQIVTTAKRIDTQDFNGCDVFEGLSFVKYMRLNTSRQEILEEVKNRGRIY